MNQKLEIPIIKRNQKIPNWIASDKLFLKEFISGFFDAEGFVYAYDKGKKLKLGITNKDKYLLEQIKRRLFEQFNIDFKCLHKKFKQDGWELRTGSTKTIIDFQKEIDFRIEEKKKKLNEMIGHRLTKPNL